MRWTDCSLRIAPDTISIDNSASQSKAVFSRRFFGDDDSWLQFLALARRKCPVAESTENVSSVPKPNPETGVIGFADRWQAFDWESPMIAEIQGDLQTKEAVKALPVWRMLRQVPSPNVAITASYYRCPGGSPRFGLAVFRNWILRCRSPDLLALFVRSALLLSKQARRVSAISKTYSWHLHESHLEKRARPRTPPKHLPMGVLRARAGNRRTGAIVHWKSQFRDCAAASAIHRGNLGKDYGQRLHFCPRPRMPDRWKQHAN